MDWICQNVPDCKFVAVKIDGEWTKVPVIHKWCGLVVRRFAEGVAITGADTDVEVWDYQNTVTNEQNRSIELPVHRCQIVVATGYMMFLLRPWQMPTEQGFLQGTSRWFRNNNETPDEESATLCGAACPQCDIAATGNTQTFNTGDSHVTLGSKCGKRFSRPIVLTDEDQLSGNITIPVNTTPRTNVDLFTVVYGYLAGTDGTDCRIDAEIPAGAQVTCEDVATRPDGDVNRLN